MKTIKFKGCNTIEINKLYSRYKANGINKSDIEWLYNECENYPEIKCKELFIKHVLYVKITSKKSLSFIFKDFINANTYQKHDLN